MAGTQVREDHLEPEPEPPVYPTLDALAGGGINSYEGHEHIGLDTSRQWSDVLLVLSAACAVGAIILPFLLF